MEEIKRRSKPFGTMTYFVSQAIKEFSDKTVRDRQETAGLLAEKYTEIDAKLAHAGANLNQAMRRINERAAAGLDYGGLLTTQLREEVQKCYDLCIEIRKFIKETTFKALGR